MIIKAKLNWQSGITYYIEAPCLHAKLYNITLYSIPKMAAQPERVKNSVCGDRGGADRSVMGRWQRGVARLAMGAQRAMGVQNQSAAHEIQYL